MSKDLKNNLKAVASLEPLLRTASANGTGVDLQFYEGALVVFGCGANTDGTHTPSLQESSDNSTWTAVAAADQLGTLAALTANTRQQVGYRGTLRYIRGVVTVTGSPATGANTFCDVIKGHDRHSPA